MSLSRVPVERMPFNAESPIAALVRDLTPTPLHYVRNNFPVPDVDPKKADKWKLSIDGHVEESGTTDLGTLRAEGEAVRVNVTMECAGNGRSRFLPRPPGVAWGDGAVSTAAFTGVRLRDVLAAVGVKPGAKEVVFRGADWGDDDGVKRNFERSLPLAAAQHEDVLLAWALNDDPLPPDHGFPLRLVVPGWYGVASVKWLEQITVIDHAFDGYFQTTKYTYDGWQDSGQPAKPVTTQRVKSLIAGPADGAHVKVHDTVLIEGRAWGGDGGVKSVEISVDGGKQWIPAPLETATLGPHAWRRFRVPWTPGAAGETEILSRATDVAGNKQPLSLLPNTHGYGYNACVPVRIVVTS